MSFIRRASLALLLLAATPAWAEEIRGRVVAIHNGDTLTILTAERQQVRVRLAEIDAPDSRQPYGNRARQALAAMFVRQNVRVVVVNTDRYGRTVGRVYAGPLDVNRELVRQGAAWVYRQHLRDRSLLAVEAKARTARRGMWSLPQRDQVPPWAWRRQQQAGRQGTTDQQP